MINKASVFHQLPKSHQIGIQVAGKVLHVCTLDAENEQTTILDVVLVLREEWRLPIAGDV